MNRIWTVDRRHGNQERMFSFAFDSHNFNAQQSVAVTASYHHLHAATELWRKGDTVEVVAVWALVERTHIEEYNQQDKQTDRETNTDEHTDDLATTTEVWDVRPDGEWQQETKHKAGEVGVVVNPRQEAKNKEHQEDCQQLNKGSDRVGYVPPAVDHFNEQARQNSKLWPCRPRLQNIQE